MNSWTINWDFSLRRHRLNTDLFLHSPRFELPMGASEQPPLPQQNQNQAKVDHTHVQTLKWWVCRHIFQHDLLIPFFKICFVVEEHSKNDISCLLLQPVPTIGRSSLSLIQLTNSSPIQRQQNNVMAAAQQNNLNTNRGPRPLDQVTCYKVNQLYICVIKAMLRLCLYFLILMWLNIVPSYWEQLEQPVNVINFSIFPLFAVWWEGPLCQQMHQRSSCLPEWTITFSLNTTVL